jgi:hypothetical protein
MRISATADVPEVQLQALAQDLSAVTSAEVDEARTFYKSVEPPSWIALLEHIPTWAAVLGPSAALVLNELLKEAAKDAYRNKVAIGRILAKPLVAPLKAMSSALARFRTANRRSQIEIGAPVPDDYVGTRLRLEGEDEESLALEIALFVKHSGAIATVLEQAQRGDAGVVGKAFLTLLPDGGLRVEWMSGSLERRTVSLNPPAP